MNKTIREISTSSKYCQRYIASVDFFLVTPSVTFLNSSDNPLTSRIFVPLSFSFSRAFLPSHQNNFAIILSDCERSRRVYLRNETESGLAGIIHQQHNLSYNEKKSRDFRRVRVNCFSSNFFFIIPLKAFPSFYSSPLRSLLSTILFISWKFFQKDQWTRIRDF